MIFQPWVSEAPREIPVAVIVKLMTNSSFKWAYLPDIHYGGNAIMTKNI
jgi:hypothetical protein